MGKKVACGISDWPSKAGLGWWTFTLMCMDVTPLTRLLSAALCPCIWEDKTRKMKCNGRAVSLPPQGNGSWRSGWLWVFPFLCKALMLLAPLILGDKAKLLLSGEAPEGHESDCSLSVQNPFCKSCQEGLFYGELFHALPASGLMFLSPDRWIVAEKPLLRTVAFQGDVQLCAPGC